MTLVMAFVLGSALAAAPPPPKPGVKTPGVKIPIERLKPEAVFPVPGSPDWIAVDEDVWISNKPKDSVARLDPKTNTVAATIQVGKRPCSGLAAAFGSLWVPNCGDQTLTRVDLKTGAVTATIPHRHRQLRRLDRRRRGQHLDHHRREGHAGALRSRDQHRCR